MTFAETAYTFFTFSLAAVMAGIMVYYFNPRRKQEIEEPKYRMLRDDE